MMAEIWFIVKVARGNAHINHFLGPEGFPVTVKRDYAHLPEKTAVLAR